VLLVYATGVAVFGPVRALRVAVTTLADYVLEDSSSAEERVIGNRRGDDGGDGGRGRERARKTRLKSRLTIFFKIHVALNAAIKIIPVDSRVKVDPSMQHTVVVLLPVMPEGVGISGEDGVQGQIELVLGGSRKTVTVERHLPGREGHVR